MAVCLACCVIAVVLLVLGFSHKKRQERKVKLYRAAIFVCIVGCKYHLRNNKKKEL